VKLKRIEIRCSVKVILILRAFEEANDSVRHWRATYFDTHFKEVIGHDQTENNFPREDTEYACNEDEHDRIDPLPYERGTNRTHPEMPACHQNLHLCEDEGVAELTAQVRE
jgi:hypothetical protein